MGIPVLIYGKSGSGKTTSLRNFKEDEILYVNIERKMLPFRARSSRKQLPCGIQNRRSAKSLI